MSLRPGVSTTIERVKGNGGSLAGIGSVAKSHGSYATISAVASTTKNLRLAYPTAGSTGVYDTCNVVTAQLS